MTTLLRNHPADLQWDWMVVSRYSEKLKPGQARGAIALITVHKGDVSKDMEVDVAQSIGRTAKAYDLRPLDTYQRRALLETVRRE